jgi:hypothetical protein
MTAISASNSGPLSNRRTTPATIRICGVPVGDFGLFSSALIALALGFITFFGVTFLSIFGLMIYNHAGGHHVTLDTSYKFFALPAGIFVLIVSLAALLIIWGRRKLTGR